MKKSILITRGICTRFSTPISLISLFQILFLSAFLITSFPLPKSLPRSAERKLVQTLLREFRLWDPQGYLQKCLQKRFQKIRLEVILGLMAAITARKKLDITKSYISISCSKSIAVSRLILSPFKIHDLPYYYYS